MARDNLSDQAMQWDMVLVPFALNLVYLAVALWFFNFMYTASRRSGQFAKLGVAVMASWTVSSIQRRLEVREVLPLPRLYRRIAQPEQLLPVRLVRHVAGRLVLGRGVDVAPVALQLVLEVQRGAAGVTKRHRRHFDAGVGGEHGRGAHLGAEPGVGRARRR